MKVKCIRGYPDELVLKKGKIYEVALIIKKARWAERNIWESGYVLINPTCSFPYIWDESRFKIIKRTSNDL